MQIKLISDQDVTRIRALLDCYQLAPSGPVAEGLLAEAAKILEWHQKGCDILAGATINDITERQHQPAGDGWIEWNGNGTHAPFDEHRGADIRFRDGDEFSTPSVIGLRWRHDGNGRDIVAYRLHTPEVGQV